MFGVWFVAYIRRETLKSTDEVTFSVHSLLQKPAFKKHCSPVADIILLKDKIF